MVLAAAVYVVVLGRYLAAAGGNWTFFVHFAAGDPVTAAFGGSAAGLWVGGGGHDGMNYYAIAQAPFDWERLRAVLSFPLLRYRRIVYPLAVHWLSFGQPALVAPLMVAVNLGATLAGMHFLRQLLARHGLGPAWTMLYAFHPGIILSLLYDLPTGLAMLGVLAGLAWWERGWRARAAVSLTFALLTWEVVALPTVLALVAHAGLTRLRSRSSRGSFPWVLGLPLVVAGVWEVVLARLFPGEMSGEVLGNFGVIGQGWGQTFAWLSQVSFDARWGFLWAFLTLAAAGAVAAVGAFFQSASLPATVTLIHALMVAHLTPPNLVWPFEVARKSLGLWVGLLWCHAHHRGRVNRWILWGLTGSTLLLGPWLPPLSAG